MSYRCDQPGQPDDGRRWDTEEAATEHADRLVREGAARTVVVWFDAGEITTRRIGDPK